MDYTSFFRVCKQCQMPKPGTEFIFLSNRVNECKECREKKRKEELKENNYKKCPDCGILQPMHRFYDSDGNKYDNCIMCRIVGQGEIDDWHCRDDLAEKYIDELDKVYKQNIGD